MWDESFLHSHFQSFLYTPPSYHTAQHSAALVHHLGTQLLALSSPETGVSFSSSSVSHRESLSWYTPNSWKAYWASWETHVSAGWVERMRVLSFQWLFRWLTVSLQNCFLRSRYCSKDPCDSRILAQSLTPLPPGHRPVTHTFPPFVWLCMSSESSPSSILLCHILS